MPTTRCTMARLAWIPVASILVTSILVAWISVVCAPLCAQDDTKTITVQLRDGRTGAPITPSNLLLRVDRHDTLHIEWVKIGDNGTITVTVPGDAKEFSLQATYGDGMETYINCDVAKQNDKERLVWYSIDLIEKSGEAAPNECGKTQYKTKPGEFIYFVRKRSAFDRLHNADAQ
jgi:hypothetical protein